MAGSVFGSDALQQNLGGFIIRVLVDETAFEGPLEDGLAETGDSLSVVQNDLNR